MLDKRISSAKRVYLSLHCSAVCRMLSDCTLLPFPAYTALCLNDILSFCCRSYRLLNSWAAKESPPRLRRTIKSLKLRASVWKTDWRGGK